MTYVYIYIYIHYPTTFDRFRPRANRRSSSTRARDSRPGSEGGCCCRGLPRPPPSRPGHGRVCRRPKCRNPYSDPSKSRPLQVPALQALASGHAARKPTELESRARSLGSRARRNGCRAERGRRGSETGARETGDRTDRDAVALPCPATRLRQSINTERARRARA